MSKAEQFLDGWLRHRLVVLEVLDQLTDKDVNFQPWEKAMTLGELVTHIVTVPELFVNAIEQGQLVFPQGQKPSFSSAAELRQFAGELTDKTQASIGALSDEKFEEMIDVSRIFGQPLPGGVLLNAMRDHEIHHKGQLFVYARMMGAETLPMYVKATL